MNFLFGSPFSFFCFSPGFIMQNISCLHNAHLYYITIAPTSALPCLSTNHFQTISPDCSSQTRPAIRHIKYLDLTHPSLNGFLQPFLHSLFLNVLLNCLLFEVSIAAPVTFSFKYQREMTSLLLLLRMSRYLPLHLLQICCSLEEASLKLQHICYKL